MLLSKVLGVIVIARNGERTSYFQDPKTYAGSNTETTALGEVESFELGATIRQAYFDPASPTYIDGISPDVVDNNEVKARVKAGVEGTVVFDSSIAFLQGLFPPNPRNKIVLADGRSVVAPLGGYQYVPVETVEPGNDRSLESWTDCPAFEKHIKEFYASDEFKKKEKDSQSFFKASKDFVFGRPLTLENAWNIFDFMNTQLMYNKTYAYRLPPTLIEQARGLADYHEDGVFSDKAINGIGNIAGRTMMHSIITALERISFNGDPLQFLLIHTTYQPFISLFHMTGIAKDHPELKGIPDYSSALIIELRRGSPPDTRDFLRFKFRNGTAGNFNDVYVFDHHSDIPLTEFIYRAENSAVTSNKQWLQVCGARSTLQLTELLFSGQRTKTFNIAYATIGLLSLFVVAMLIKRSRAKARDERLRLPGAENSFAPVQTAEKRFI